MDATEHSQPQTNFSSVEQPWPPWEELQPIEVSREPSHTEVALAWLQERSLPEVGYVLFWGGYPVAWEVSQPSASKVAPGSIALRLSDGVRLMALGGSVESGAARWSAYEGPLG